MTRKNLPMKDERAPDPISAIEWRLATSLKANRYNPNTVFTPEMKLLERSLLRQGRVQPVPILKAGAIIDGVPRATITLGSDLVKARWGGKVPCAILDATQAEAMIITIRMNRAKGSHAAVKMSEIVRELIDVHHYDPQEVAIEIGATADEVELLRQDGVFKNKKIDQHPYSKAWYPAETGKKGAAQ